MIFETITSKDAPEAIGPYSPLLRACDFILISGQLPIDPKTNEIVEGDIEEQTKQCIKNMEALLKAADLSLAHVVKTTIFLTDLSLFSRVNEVYGTFFKEPYPARSCIEVKALPKGAPIEIEALALDTRSLEVLCAGEEVEEDCTEKACTCK